MCCGVQGDNGEEGIVARTIRVRSPGIIGGSLSLSIEVLECSVTNLPRFITTRWPNGRLWALLISLVEDAPN